MRPGGRRLVLCCGYVRDRWVHWGAHWECSGSFGVAGFIRFLPGGRRVRLGSLGSFWRSRSGSLGSLGRTLAVVGFVWDRWVHFGAPVRGRWVHWGAHRVRSGSLGSLWCVLRDRRLRLVHWGEPWESLGSFGVALVIRVRPCRRVRSAPLGLLESALEVVGFVRDRRIHWGAHWRSSGSFGVAAFIVLRPGGRRVRSGFIGVRPWNR